MPFIRYFLRLVVLIPAGFIALMSPGLLYGLASRALLGPFSEWSTTSHMWVAALGWLLGLPLLIAISSWRADERDKDFASFVGCGWFFINILPFLFAISL